MFNTVTVIRLVLVLSQIGIWWHAANWYPRIPDRFPIHFDLAGTPDGWANKSIATWFMLPGCATGISVLLVLIGWVLIPLLAAHSPEFINIPNKARFLKLSADDRVRTMQPMTSLLTLVAALVTMLFGSLLEQTARVAVGEAAFAKPWELAIFLPVMAIATALAIARTIRNINRSTVD